MDTGECDKRTFKVLSTLEENEGDEAPLGGPTAGKSSQANVSFCIWLTFGL